MSVKLLPCPFCGSNAHITEEDSRFFAGCDDCFCAVGEAYDGCAMPNHCFYEEEAAAQAWNTRSLTDVVPDTQKTL
jgi:hypothetical protein